MLPKGLPNEEERNLKTSEPRARDDRLWRRLQRLAVAVQNAPRSSAVPVIFNSIVPRHSRTSESERIVPSPSRSHAQ
jgi:hypothetical protein